MAQARPKMMVRIEIFILTGFQVDGGCNELREVLSCLYGGMWRFPGRSYCSWWEYL